MKINSECALQFKALSDETRLKIISMLSAGDMCACHLLEKVDITQPTLSYHMKMLVKSKLVSSKKEGAWIRYSLNKAAIANLVETLNNI